MAVCNDHVNMYESDGLFTGKYEHCAKYTLPCLCTHLRDFWVFASALSKVNICDTVGPIYKGRGYSSEILKRTPKRQQDLVLWVWLEIFSPLRGTNRQHIN